MVKFSQPHNIRIQSAIFVFEGWVSLLASYPQFRVDNSSPLVYLLLVESLVESLS
jgi:hypothetical protein